MLYVTLPRCVCVFYKRMKTNVRQSATDSVLQVSRYAGRWCCAFFLVLEGYSQVGVIAYPPAHSYLWFGRDFSRKRFRFCMSVRRTRSRARFQFCSEKIKRKTVVRIIPETYCKMLQSTIVCVSTTHCIGRVSTPPLLSHFFRSSADGGSGRCTLFMHGLVFPSLFGCRPFSFFSILQNPLPLA